MAGQRRWLAWIAAVALIATTAVTGGGIAQAAPDPVAPKVLKTGKPTISGTLAVGSTLKAKTGTWTAKTTFSYQWLRDGGAIKGATKSSYKLAAADAGAQFSVTVTGKRKGYATAGATSAATVRVVKPATPKISGTVMVGAELTAVPGNWSPGMRFTYQWLRSGKKIKGATSATHKVGKSDIGKQLSVTVVGKQSGWATVSRTSAKTSKVLKAGSPTISGTVAIGSTVKVKAGSWTSKTKLSYQWLRQGTAIKGATKSSYKITTADAGRQLSVKVTGKKKGYVTTSKTSAPRAVAMATMKASAPTIGGTARIGQTLTANPGVWTSGATLTYQWYAGGSAITGASGKTFAITYREGGKKITVVVTGTKSGYATTKRTSAPTATVPAAPTKTTRDGYHKIGVDLAPGTYVAAGGSQCYWERRKDDKESLAGNLASGPYHSGRVIVTILPSDPFFASWLCGEWTLLPVTGSPEPLFPDGDHAVGVHVPPGTYLSYGGEQCFWWRLGAAGLELDNAVAGSGGVHAAGPIHNGQTIVTISPSDKFFTSTGCGFWWALADRVEPMSYFRDGDYAVGVNVFPGIWKSTTFTDECYVEMASGFAGTDDEILWWGTPEPDDTELELPIYPGDVRLTTVGCGTWERFGDLPEEGAADGPTGASASSESEREFTGVDGAATARGARQIEARDRGR